MCKLDGFQHLLMDTNHNSILKAELGLWHQWYLPKNGLPQSVLDGRAAIVDLGAGNGETAQFYLNHGAKNIICIDSDTRLLHENFANNPRVTIIEAEIGLVKSDCEGGERNMIVEGAHGIPFRWHRLNNGFLVDNYIWRFEEDWGSLGERLRRRLVRTLAR